jgi:hypothetical protein
MRRITAVVLVVVIIVATVGLWRGWFDVSSHRAPSEGKVDVNLTVDTAQMKEDAATVKEKTAELTEKVVEEARELGGVSDDPVEEPTNPRTDRSLL